MAKIHKIINNCRRNYFDDHLARTSDITKVTCKNCLINHERKCKRQIKELEKEAEAVLRDLDEARLEYSVIADRLYALKIWPETKTFGGKRIK
jgi:septation ring formation regulator EzrA